MLCQSSTLSHRLVVLFSLCLFCGLLAGCGNRGKPGGPSGTSGSTIAAEPGTYAAIAPILHDNCTTCHRPGGAGPFSLLDAKQAQKRASLIAEVLRDGSMPPWLPSDKGLPLADSRVLSATNRAALIAWAESGGPPGDRKAVPTPPPYDDSGWQLGTPDAVTGLGTPITVPADGPDVFRNIVIPWPESRRRYVKSVEIRPGNQRAVHHAILKVDRSGLARHFDDRDPGPGFTGMEMGGARSPSGHFIGASVSPSSTTRRCNNPGASCCFRATSTSPPVRPTWSPATASCCLHR